jgi:hypothetical protein
MCPELCRGFRCGLQGVAVDTGARICKRAMTCPKTLQIVVSSMLPSVVCMLAIRGDQQGRSSSSRCGCQCGLQIVAVDAAVCVCVRLTPFAVGDLCSALYLLCCRPCPAEAFGEDRVPQC